MSPASTVTSETVRGLKELVAQLVGVDGGQVVVIAIVSDERGVPPVGRRTEGMRHGPRTAPFPTTKEHRPDGSGWARLTDRERTVARLAGYALTNQQIANRLRISPHTVNFHLRQVFRKLGIDSRVSLARIVEAHPPLVDPPARSGPTEPS